MLRREKIDSLSEEELALLLLLVNEYRENSTKTTLLSYKQEFLEKRILDAKNRMTEEGTKVLESILNKIQ